jgi:hypothetical protein
MKITLIAALSIATAATALPLAAVAHADHSFSAFLSPSGNIRCVLYDHGQNPLAACQVGNHTYVAPPASPCADGGAAPGSEFRLEQGQQPHLPCEYTPLDSGEGNQLPTLAYGQTSSLGTITCDSEPTGVTCTDTSTGHFFRVSRDSYQLG